MPRKKPKIQVVTAEVLPVGEIQEFNTFDEAYASLMSQLDPGGSIDLHEEDCALVVDGPECTCVPHRITKGPSA